MKFKEITVAQTQALIASREVVLLDRRDAQSYRAGHIEQAMLAHDGLIESLINKRDRSRPIVIYCYKGNDSKELAALFGQFGFEAYSVIGGYTEWKKQIQKLTQKTLDWLKAQGFADSDIHTTIANRTTPLMHACRHGALEIARELIEAGAELNQRNADGNTALWLACYANYVEIIRLLIAAGADLNNQNDNGATALLYAASAGRTESVKCLLAGGADPHLATLDDFSALDVAANRDILGMLRPYFG
ncbi:MAG: ankyrin repeat domain-containing protein [Pseudomonadota bacterium]